MFRVPILASYLLTGVVSALAFSPYANVLYKHDPYSLVTENLVSWEDYHVDFSYDFLKNEGCSLVTFNVSGSSAGVEKPLDYIDLDGIPEDFDRQPGEHTLNIRVLTEGVYYEAISLLTRHLCGDTYINKRFVTVVNPNEKQ